MLKEVDIDIWVAEQPFRYLGLSVGNRMTVIRLANQELAVISPIQSSDRLVSQLGELGVVKYIIAPNLYHYLFAANFKSIYPQATFWAAPGLTIKKPDLPIDQTIRGDRGELLPGLDFVLFDALRVLGLTGIDSLNECVFFHSASRTLILTDTAFNFDETFPIMTQLSARVLGGYKQLSLSILERIATNEKERVRQSFEQVMLWDFERVIMAHGSIIERYGKEKFKKGYESFLR
ncbi:DUF4336 domain-containing protein [Lyngbya sp. CCY1209]|uniref:DUF4336 domain-containing protein n=1 Tax=Lyngbya sp. CCY1209 TaxID=2886103 RepID=UPI002D20B72B|nr:DUF4336 domain-containing protein [Lyngbya sp. CCY1209]MEB3883164.1 DUF4336 domain-containing protein [Lyngbya sp. CCY1209]